MNPQVRKLTFAALLVAVGVLSAHLIYIPVFMSKCFPVQHAVNILLAAGPGARYAVGAAFAISLLRNIMGTGTVLAFPGSMCGAALAGILYKRTHSIYGAIFGEIIGTGVFGALAAYPTAKFLLHSDAGALFFIGPFFASTASGAAVAYALYQTPIQNLLAAMRHEKAK